MKGWLVAALLLWGSLVPGVARAEPQGFGERWRASFMGGVMVTQFAVGELGEVTGNGIGLAFQEFIQKGYWGFGARVSSSYHLSSPGQLPFDTGFVTYVLGLDVRNQFPIWRGMMIPVKYEYAFVGFASNTLVDVEGLGNSKGLHAVGLGTGLQYILDGWFFELEVHGHYLPEVGSLRLVYGLSVGFSDLW